MKASKAFMRRLSTLVFCCATSVVCAQTLPADLGERLTKGYVVGAMQGFEHASAGLAQSLQAWCAAPDDAKRASVRDRFAETVASWSGIEFLRFGPLVQANRFERIFFWPDPRGVTLRQVQALLAATIETAGDAQVLATRSVALQGLPALEYVLYRDSGLLTGTSKAFAIECAYASAVTHNLAERARELAQAWRADTDYGALFSRPGSDNPVYRSQREVASEAFKSLSTGLQFLREIKLVPVLGDGSAASEARRARRAPFWRSEISVRAFHASVVGLRAFLRAGAYQDGTGIVANLDEELTRAEELLAGMSAPLAELLSDAEHTRQLQLLVLLLDNAKRLLDENMAPAFGVTIGFNALDGD